MSQFVKSEWIPILMARLPVAESALKSWLDERGLAQTDIPQRDVAREVSRMIDGGTGCTYLVRRSRLLEFHRSGRLKPHSNGAYGPFARPAKKYSTVRILSNNLTSNGAPAGTIAWVEGRDLDESENNRYRLEVSSVEGGTRTVEFAGDGDIEVIDSPVGIDD
jgi:hypothetical protein